MTWPGTDAGAVVLDRAHVERALVEARQAIEVKVAGLALNAIETVIIFIGIGGADDRRVGGGGDAVSDESGIGADVVLGKVRRPGRLPCPVVEETKTGQRIVQSPR